MIETFAERRGCRRALQLTADDANEFCEWVDGFRQPTHYLMVWVRTAHRNAFEGDWAVQEPDGFRIVSPDVFLNRYTAVRP